MTPSELAADLRSRINPIYAAQLGTESYERRICAEALEALIAERDTLVATIKQTLDENGHLADGENCTLIALKRGLKEIGEEWNG